MNLIFFLVHFFFEIDFLCSIMDHLLNALEKLTDF